VFNVSSDFWVDISKVWAVHVLLTIGKMSLFYHRKVFLSRGVVFIIGKN
jgi:hypothetical protein